ncbi:hypothetical protein H0H92_010145 [Tricholoma furcatifolium]|nr:hypothetical protein H0H92_010145 [Tricholoma furcatifolium]
MSVEEWPAKALPAEYYNDFLSKDAKDRKPSPIRSLFPLEHTPGLISLLAGKPNPSTFPFTSFSFTANSPVENGADVSLTVDEKELAAGLQYGATAGYEPLCEWLYGLQEFSHGRKRGADWALSVGSGSQDLIYKVGILRLDYEGINTDISYRRSLLSLILEMLSSWSRLFTQVETDAHGIKSTSLRSILENWPADKSKPRVLYTVPYGCNPTGMTATTERRKEVLALSREHNFLILEDDPYYYLYYGKAARYPSYFKLELEEEQTGRVLRFDSLSKILSAGIRIGFVSGPKTVLAAMNAHTATSNLQVSSLTQVIVFKLLQAWGFEAFIKHTEKVSNFYREKRDVFEAAMKRHLSGLAEWDSPEAGMFFWFKLLLSDDPSQEGDSQALIAQKAVQEGVLALPGTAFLPNGRKTAYVRASFSLLGEEDVDEALRRLAKVIRDNRA